MSIPDYPELWGCEMDHADIPFLSATELASNIEAKLVSPTEAVEAYLDRIDSIDPEVNAYITVRADQVRQDARSAESELLRRELGGFSSRED